MNISKTSWHYKVVANTFCSMDRWWPSQSLCIYFWQVILRLVLGLALGLILVSPLVTIITYVTGTIESSHVLVQLYASVGFVIGTLYLLGLLVFIFVLLYEGVGWVSRKFPKKHKEPKEPSLLLAYIKAKKDRVCPMITFL